MIEKCIRCGKPTPYHLNTPITPRRYFIEGSGQLCAECYRKLYFKENAYCENNRLSQRGSDRQDKIGDKDPM